MSNNMQEHKHKTSHVVIIPTPGMGHLFPLIELAKRILEAHPFTISFIIPTERPPTQAQKSAVGALSKERIDSYFFPEPAVGALPKGRIDSYFLPPVNLDDLPLDAKIETRIALTLARSLPAVRTQLRDLQSTHHGRLAALVVDLFGTDAFDVALEFGMKPYMVFPGNAMSLSFLMHLPELDAQVSCEFKDMEEPVQLPGCVPLNGRDLLDAVHDRKNDAYKWLLHHASRYNMAEGMMVNSFIELEKGALKAFQNPKSDVPPVYPVGPLVQAGSGDDKVDGSGCLKWLDEQPRDSVLFVSFGSGGTLSYDQLTELALGLEMSEQRFLWVVRAPNEVANATYFSTEKQRDPLGFLPKGFLDRTKRRGLVIPNWAPQIKVLSHESTGGFLTHCGWNSILEGLMHGVSLIAWPLYAEQKMNAVMLTDGLKVALRPNSEKNGLVGRGEIVAVAKGLMEGEEGKIIRNRVKDLKDAASRVLSVDGSSTKALSEVALKWQSH